MDPLHSRVHDKQPEETTFVRAHGTTLVGIAGFSKLPVEILRMIRDLIGKKKDLKALRLAVREFEPVLGAVLFESIIIHGKDECVVRKFEKSFYRLNEDESALDTITPWIKHLHFRAPLHRHLGFRCPDQIGTVKDQPFNPANLAELGQAIVNVLRRLPDECLRSFSWDMGICIPEEVIGSGGLLQRKQKAIESLSLLTGGFCKTSRENFPSDRNHLFTSARALDLAPFRSVCRFSWNGIKSLRELEYLSVLIYQQAEILQALEIGIISWDKVLRHWLGLGIYGETLSAENYPNLFDMIVFPKSKRRRLKSLTYLSLDNVPLHSHGQIDADVKCWPEQVHPPEAPGTHERMADLLNIYGLRTLKLRQCEHASQFLLYLVNDMRIPRPLPSLAGSPFPGISTEEYLAPIMERFEFVSYGKGEDEESGVIDYFLRFINGLKHLYIHSYEVPNGSRDPGLPAHMLNQTLPSKNHFSTLERLIMDIKDDPHEFFIPRVEKLDAKVDSFLRPESLDCLGLNDRGQLMALWDFDLDTPKSCRLIHIRCSGGRSEVHGRLNALETMGKKHLGNSLVQHMAEDLTNSDWFGYPGPQERSRPWDSVSELVPVWRLWNSLNATERLLRENRRPEEQPYITGWNNMRYSQQPAYGPLADRIYAFALSAFSSYPRLEIVALGDFSYNGRWQARNILFARDSSCEAEIKFRVIKTEEINDWTGVEDPLDFLSACAEDEVLSDVYDHIADVW